MRLDKRRVWSDQINRRRARLPDTELSRLVTAASAIPARLGDQVRRRSSRRSDTHRAGALARVKTALLRRRLRGLDPRQPLPECSIYRSAGGVRLLVRMRDQKRARSRRWTIWPLTCPIAPAASSCQCKIKRFMVGRYLTGIVGLLMMWLVIGAGRTTLACANALCVERSHRLKPVDSTARLKVAAP